LIKQTEVFHVVVVGQSVRGSTVVAGRPIECTVLLRAGGGSTWCQ